MSYGPGSSQYLRSLVVGAGAWLTAVAAFIVLLVGVFGVWVSDPLVRTVQAYAITPVWFIGLVSGDVELLVVAVGVSVYALFVTAGVVAAVWSETDTVRSAVTVGLAVAAGHGLLTALAFGTVGVIGPYGTEPTAATRTFLLAFGGFAVPAVLAVLGAVATQQFRTR